MPVTLNHIKRLQVLHQLLSVTEGITWQEIKMYYQTKGYPVSRETVFKDLKALEKEGAELNRHKGKISYKKEFSLLGQYNIKDAEFAKEVTTLLEQFAEFPPFKGLEDIWIKLKARIPNSKKKNFVQFEQNDEYAGLKRLQEIYEAIKAKKTLKIHFQDFSKSQKAYSISPYMLKEYHNRWHVYGYEHKKRKIYNLALDRILAIDTSDFRYRNQQVDDLAFLNDIIGFTYLYDAETETYAALETVKIKVDLPRANYIRTKPLHHSQQEVSKETNETYVVFTYQLRFNNELFAKLLEFGKDLEILEPRHLREKMTVHIQEMAKKYGI
jgi:predicted DNA-binding transcriptional regulator YafY